MMPAHDLRNFGPGKLNPADDLVTDDRVIRHRTEFVRIECARFPEQMLIHRYLADVVEISGGTQSCRLARIKPQGFSDGGRVASHAQGMSLNVDVLNVDRGSEGFQRVVVEPVQRG